MSRSINRVTLLGHVGADPEKRTTKAGKDYVNLSVATSYRTKDGAGKSVEHTSWHNVVVFAEDAVKACQFVKKGSRVLVEGTVSYRTYVDKQGVERDRTEIVVGVGGGQLVLLDRAENGAKGTLHDDMPF